MRQAPIIAPLAVLLACSFESDPVTVELQAHSFKNSEWSEPVNLGPVVNSSFNDQNPEISPDGRSLYFTSNRPGGFGGNDIWVSRRACIECPWEAAVNLGPVINTPLNDDAPGFSTDGHMLFFISIREGGFGSLDIYVSQRTHTDDDFAWGPPKNLGPEVNGPGVEAGPQYLPSAEDGPASLYFVKTTLGQNDIYYAAVTRNGDVRGSAVFVTELNDPVASDAGPAVRHDGREVFLFSNRSGTLGSNDLWVATRQSVHQNWSTPVNVGAPVSTEFNDLQASLLDQGRTLLFASNRPGGSGNLDIWMSTRTTNGK